VFSDFWRDDLERRMAARFLKEAENAVLYHPCGLMVLMPHSSQKLLSIAVFRLDAVLGQWYLLLHE
jgi:hypothetical protein